MLEKFWTIALHYLGDPMKHLCSTSELNIYYFQGWMLIWWQAMPLWEFCFSVFSANSVYIFFMYFCILGNFYLFGFLLPLKCPLILVVCPIFTLLSLLLPPSPLEHLFCLFWRIGSFYYINSTNEYASEIFLFSDIFFSFFLGVIKF